MEHEEQTYDRRLLKLLVDSSYDWETWVDPEGRFRYTSPSCERVTGYPSERFMADPGLLLSIIHPDDRPMIARHLEDAPDPRASAASIEFRIIRAGGETRWLSHSCAPIFSPGGAFIGRRGSNRDITVRKDAEHALHESGERFRLLHARLAQGVYYQDPDGSIVDANPAAVRILRLPKDGSSRCNARNLPLVDEGGCGLPLAAQPAEVAFRTGKPVSDVVLGLQTGVGATITWLSVSAAPELTSDGTAVRVLVTLHDITALKRAGDALRVSEQGYRRLFEDAIEGIILADPETGLLVDCNKAFQRLSGYDRSELVGRHQSVLHVGVEGAKTSSATFVKHASGAHGQVLADRIRTRSGDVRDVDIKADFVELSGRRLLQGFFRDTTLDRRHQREHEITISLMGLLHERNRTHELIQKITSSLREWTGCEAAGIRLRDGNDFPYFETNGFPSRFVMAESSLCIPDVDGKPQRDAAGNAELACMCGNVLCRRFDTRLPFFTANGSFWTNSTTQLLASTNEQDRQARTRNRCNGEGYESVALIPLRHGGETLGLVQLNDHQPGKFTRETIATLESLADQVAIALAQRRAMEALEASERRYRELTAAVGEFIWEIDMDGRITFISERVQDILGYEPAELVGKKLTGLGGLVGADDARKIALWTAGGSRVFRGLETAVTDKAGRRVWLLTTGLARHAPGGGRTGLRCVSTDITERKRLESELLQAQKMEAVGQLAGGIAHDFNNLLQVITGSLDNALVDVPRGTPLHADLDEALKASERASALTSQLLAFSRRGVTAPVVLDVNAVVFDSVKMLRRIVGEHIEVLVNPALALRAIRADRGNIVQVIMNLCVNARDAMPDGGTLTIVTENVTVDQGQRGSYVRLSVRDDGQGMDAETRARIFEPFFTTKSPGHGTGLGLATVYGIVKAHGGFIEVESAPRQGSWFKIYFPSVNNEAAPEGAQVEGTAAGGRETVLVCEDDPAVLRYVTRLLGTSGYTVIGAHDGWEGVQAFAERERRVDLAVLDVMMPKLGGQGVMERIRSVNPGVRFLFTTGYADTVISASFSVDTSVRVLRKPYQRNELLRAVREILDEPAE